MQLGKTTVLEGVVTEPRPLNNAQRKALAEIVEKRLGTKADQAREREHALEQQIVGKLVKRFKVDAMQSQIEKLEQDIANLKKLRNDLGFETGYAGEFSVTGGEAKQLLETEVKEHSLAIRQLEDLRDVLKQGVWLAETVEEARKVIQQVEGL